MNQNNNELRHYGVLGMKWGKRRALPESETLGKIRKTKAAIKARKKSYLNIDAELDGVYKKSYNDTYKKLIKSGATKRDAARSANTIATQRAESYDNKAYSKYQSDMSKLKSQHKAAKQERKNKINSTFNKLQNNASLGESIFYNDATRKKAAKYIVDNNMSVADAKKKANNEAIRNTVVIMGVIAGMSINTFKK